MSSQRTPSTASAIQQIDEVTGDRLELVDDQLDIGIHGPQLAAEVGEVIMVNVVWL